MEIVTKNAITVHSVQTNVVHVAREIRSISVWKKERNYSSVIVSYSLFYTEQWTK